MRSTFIAARALCAVALLVVGCARVTPPPTTAPALPDGGPGVFSAGDERSLIYLIDASGEMYGYQFNYLRDELRRAVLYMRPEQKVNIIFMGEDSPMALDKAGLVPATYANREKMIQLIFAVHAQSQSDPIPGLELAFRQRPEAIMLVTCGDFPDNDHVTKYIDEHTKDRGVRINTIAFGAPGEGYQKLLRKIAERSGGWFKFVTWHDFGK